VGQGSIAFTSSRLLAKPRDSAASFTTTPIGPSAWGRQAFEEEKLLGDPWPQGLEKNRANLERFVGYSLDQGLMSKKMAVEDLFLPLN
jgi:hypothetical protein